MKKLMLMMAVLALVAIAGYSEDAKETKEPSELTAAKKAYAEAKDKIVTAAEKALEPVRAKQIATLEKLKVRLTKAGDLAGATAVQAELDALAGKMSDKFIGIWKWAEGATAELKADGTAELPRNAWTGTWEMRAEKIVIVWGRSGYTDSIDTKKISADGAMKMTNNHGSSYQVYPPVQ